MICLFIHLFVCSFHPSVSSLSYDKCINSSKANSPQSAIWCFLFQFVVFCRFLKVVQYLFTTSFSFYLYLFPPPVSPSVMCLECSSYTRCDQSN
jgi:hypothetical protein